MQLLVRLMNSLQKRDIARMVFVEIRAVIEKWEGLRNIPIKINWDRHVQVDGDLFGPSWNEDCSDDD